jgi:hypothetical protein
MGTRVRTVGASLLIGIAMCLSIVGWAGATTGSYQAATGTCTTTTDGGFCISQVNDTYTSTTITLSVTVGQATDPTTDTNWTTNKSDVEFALYLNGATTASYDAILADDLATPAAYEGAVQASTSGSTPTCLGTTGNVTATDSVSANTYTISFPATCISSPTSLAVTAAVTYNTSSDTGTTSNAPAEGTCCSVTPDAATTTTSSTTTTTTSSTTTTTSSSTTTTTVPSTTTTIAPVTAASTSSGNTGSGSSSSLATTGAGRYSPFVVVFAALLVGLGVIGRRVARRRRFTKERAG